MADPDPENPPVPAPAAPPPGNPAPPAARVVLTGNRTERELALESDLEAERSSHARTAKEKKERETKIAELEDQIYRLRHPEPPRPAKQSKSAMEEFFEG